jgi:hypothetical protein
VSSASKNCSELLLSLSDIFWSLYNGCFATGRFTTAALRLLIQLLLTDHFLWPIRVPTFYNNLKNPQIKLCGFIFRALKITQIIIEKTLFTQKLLNKENNTIDI